MRLIDRLASPTTATTTRAALTATDLTEVFTTYSDMEASRMSHAFKTYAAEGYESNGSVFALIAARALVFAEAKFIYRNRQSGELKAFPMKTALLERPWPSGTTADMLTRMEIDVSLAGNSFMHKTVTTATLGQPSHPRLRRLRPDWVDLVVVDEELLGFIYWPDGKSSGNDAEFMTIEEVAHFAPIKSGISTYKGQSWLTAVAREVDTDSTMLKHRQKFFENAATPNLLVKVQGRLSKDSREDLRHEFERKYGSWENAYKTAILDGGADVQVVGSSFEAMIFDKLQSMNQTTLAAAAGVPPVIVGFSKGLESATYSNYQLAMRRWADNSIRPAWRQAAGAFVPIIGEPAGWELWYDDRDIPALQQDAKDDADIHQTQAGTMRTLIDGGFTPESVVPAVVSGDLSTLEHSGKLSVQLQDASDTADMNGDSDSSSDQLEAQPV